MIKRTIWLALSLLLIAAFVSSGVLGKAWYDPSAESDTQVGKVTQYSFPQVRSELTAKEFPKPIDPEEAAAKRAAVRVSLGAVDPGGVSSPGFTVYNTWMDDQYRPPAGRAVDFRTTPDLHFVYSRATGPASTSIYGYNVYNPVLGDWPRGAGVGCNVQATDAEGQWVMMDVDPRGFVVMGGEDDASGSADNHFYWQSAQHSCFFGAGSQILPSQYNDGHFLNPTVSTLSHPKVEVQELASDTIVHVLAGETDSESDDYFPDLNWGVTSYYRMVGTGGSGTWEGPTVIDTNAWGFTGSMSASRVSPKVAVSYTMFHQQAFVSGEVFDCEVYMRTSDDAGANWGPPTNVTTYSRVEPAATAWLETSTLYDSNDKLHIIWNATATPEDVYNDNIYFWGEFSASIFHWSNAVAGPKAGGTIVKVHDANWGIEYNTQVCGFGSPGTMYVGFMSLSECNGRLYTFFSQYLDARGNWDTGPQIDDCASGGFSDRLYAANGELAMATSSSLDGLLWDAARNLTNTYTPNCDSAGFGGVCMNDTRMTAARYGMDVTAFDTSGVPVTLIWPGAELVDPTPAGDPAYSGDHFVHLTYLEDHFPGPGWRNVDQYGPLTNNALNWMRVACVTPVEAPQILTSPESIGYPDYIDHGEADTVTVIVTNDGNVPLTVDSILTDEDVAGPSGWLGVSAAGFVVGAGVNNTATFDMYLNVGGVVNSPGTIVALNGSVALWSDAANVNPAIIEVDNFLVADTVIGFAFDTLSTTATPRAAEPGEYVSLIVTNTGEMGFNGNSSNGTLNLDYTSGGPDCNTDATTYLYSGGPMLIRADVDGTDTTFLLSQAMFGNVFSLPTSFKRVFEGEPEASISDPAFDGYFTGTCVNQDSSIAMERTYYAPLTGGDSTDFIIAETRYFSNNGSPHNSLIIGETIDWDIPGGIGDIAINVSGVLADNDVVYQQGVDTTTDPLCQPNANRFGTVKLLGYLLNSELGDNPCAGKCTPYGAFANRNDSLFDVDDSLQPAYFWEKMTEKSGLNAEPSGEEEDLHMVMTYAHDFSLPANDTLTVYSVVTSVHNGDTTQLKGNLDAAFEWYRNHLRNGCELLCGCCEGLTGNVDNDPGGLTDIGDLTALIAYLYIPPNPVPECPEEANIDGDGAGLIDIGDLTALIAYLYIPPNPDPAPCQ